jgi:hypothetical protein
MIVTLRTLSFSRVEYRPALLRPAQIAIVRPIPLLITVLILHVPSEFDNRLLVTDRASTDGSNLC